jgi:hypothetical protein
VDFVEALVRISVEVLSAHACRCARMSPRAHVPASIVFRSHAVRSRERRTLVQVYEVAGSTHSPARQLEW